MIAVFKTGGKQYRVKPGQVLKIEKINGKKGDSLAFNDILALSDSAKNIIGDPLVKGASIEAKIIDQIRDKKIIVFKKRRRQNYRSTQGHRQYLTVLKIESIIHENKKAVAPKIAKKQDTTKTKAVNKQLKKIDKKIENKTKDKIVVKKTSPKKDLTKKKIVKKKLIKKTVKNNK